MNIDQIVRDAYAAAGLSPEDVAWLRDAEARAMRDGRPGFGDARRNVRPSARLAPAAPSRTVSTLAAVRGRVATFAARFWSDQA